MEKDDIYDLIYANDRKEYVEIKNALIERFSDGIIEDASDDIHHDRFSVWLKKNRKDYLKFILQNGFYNCSLTVQCAMYKEDDCHKELKNIIEGMKKEK